MANLDFRVLLDTISGSKYSYVTASLVNTSEPSLVVYTDVMVDKINSMVSGAYVDKAGETGRDESIIDIKAGKTFGTPGYILGDAQIAYLSMSIKDHTTSGSIVFNETTTGVTGDYLKRYKFYGTKVCNVLGIPENFWIYTDEFRLSNTGSEVNYIQGNIYADGVNVATNLSVGNAGSVSSDLPIKIDKTTDRWIKYVDVHRSGSFPTNKMMMGYSMNDDQYQIKMEKDTHLHITGSVVSSSTIHTNNLHVKQSASFGDGPAYWNIGHGTQATYDNKVGDVHIHSHANEGPNDADTYAHNLYLTNKSRNIGTDDNTFGGSIAFGPGGTNTATENYAAAAIASKNLNQADADYIGLSFFTHKYTNQASVMSETMHLSYTGQLSCSDDIVLFDGGFSEDTLVRIYDSNDDGVIDVYQNNSVVNRIHGNGASFIGAGSLSVNTTNTDTSAELTVEGDISASGHIDVKGSITGSGDLVMGGDISASGNIYTDNGQAFLGGGVSNNDAVLTLTNVSNDYSASLIQGTTDTFLKLNQATSQDFSIDTHETDANFFIEGAGGNVGIKTSTPPKALTVEGSISASDAVHCPNFYFDSTTTSDNLIGYNSTFDSVLVTSQDINLNAANGVGIGRAINYNNTAALDVNGDISASGDINASGDITSTGDISTSGNLYLQNDKKIYFGYGDNTYIYESNSNEIDIYANGDRKLMISSTGVFTDTGVKMAIGRTLIGSEPLTVEGNISASGNLYLDTAGADIYIGGGGAQAINFGDSDDDNIGRVSYIHSSDTLQLYAGASYHLTVTSHGNVGIETSTPAETLTVEGNISASGNIYVGSGSLSPAYPLSVWQQNGSVTLGTTGKFITSPESSTFMYSREVSNLEMVVGGRPMIVLNETTADTCVVAAEYTTISGSLVVGTAPQIANQGAGLQVEGSISASTNIGVNTNDIRGKVHLKQSTNAASSNVSGQSMGDGLIIENTNGEEWVISIDGEATQPELVFQQRDIEGTQNTGGGFLYGQNWDGDYDAFTGQHKNIPTDNDINNYTSSVGLIVVSDGVFDNISSGSESGKNETKPNINESLPKVSLSTIAKDKKVFGVVSETEDDNNNKRVFQWGIWGSFSKKKNENDTRLIINSLGEGAIWVSNYSGSLENGDYITTSPIEGLGMKQDDDLLHNYTVAKITQDCTFDLNASGSYDCVEFEWSGSTYRKAFVGCTYHCG